MKENNQYFNINLRYIYCVLLVTRKVYNSFFCVKIHIQKVILLLADTHCFSHSFIIFNFNVPKINTKLLET